MDDVVDDVDDIVIGSESQVAKDLRSLCVNIITITHIQSRIGVCDYPMMLLREIIMLYGSCKDYMFMHVLYLVLSHPRLHLSPRPRTSCTDLTASYTTDDNDNKPLTLPLQNS